MRRLLATVSLAALAIAGALPEALAYLKAGPNMAGDGHHRLKVPGGGALDTFTTPLVAYSFRKLRSAYAGPAIRIRRASDNAELDIPFLGGTSFTGAPWDVAAAAAHCASTTCFARTRYDQSGAARDEAQATAANQFELVFNCNGALPCLRTTTNTQTMVGPSVTPASGVVSFSTVANRSAGTGACQWLRENGANNRWSAAAVANTWVMQNTGSLNATASDATWHSAQAVMNGASSVFAVDGAEVTGTVAGNTTAGALQSTGAATTTCLFSEDIAWDAYSTTPAERAALTANQRSYYGTP